MFKEQLVNKWELKYAPKTQETDEYGHNREDLNDKQGNRYQRRHQVEAHLCETDLWCLL